VFCNILALRKVVDLLEAFTPTASILGSLSLRALTDQFPSDDTIVAAAKEQSKAAAGKVAIAAAYRAALYPRLQLLQLSRSSTSQCQAQRLTTSWRAQV